MATHRLTQSSTTLNRRYVKRPSSLAVEQAAREAARKASTTNTAETPSRLVNLGVRSSDLQAAQAREAAEIAARQLEAAEIAARQLEAAERIESRNLIMPHVVEYGTTTTTVSEVPASTAIAEPEVEELAQEITPSQDDITEAPTEKAAQSSIEEPETPTKMNSADIDTAKLALSIAADYAAASMGASIQEYGENYQNYAIEQQETNDATETPAAEVSNTPEPETSEKTATYDSVDAIAAAASQAIASIRTATEPTEVSEQVASLKAFAENIKANHSAPEMRELGDTIEKFVSVAMKSSKVQEEVAKKSTKTARAANKVTKSSAKVMAANHASLAKHGVGIGASKTATSTKKLATRSTTNNTAARSVRKPSAEELKDRAIRQALRSVATMEDETGHNGKVKKLHRKGNGKRLALAIACAAVCVGGIVYFVSTNIPDISVKVAALQTGVEASYPSYVPRDYTLADISSENGKITMVFDGPDDSSFTLDEEKSSWDSSALLRNYVEPTWGNDYATTHEQGITIYISNTNSDAAWVNGGVLYKITSKGTALTKKQVRSIVTSM